MTNLQLKFGWKAKKPDPKIECKCSYKVATKVAPALCRFTNFSFNDCVTSRMGLGVHWLQVCGDQGVHKKNKNRKKIAKWSLYLCSLYHCAPVSLSLSPSAPSCQFKLYIRRFAVFLNVNLRQQLLLLPAFGFIMTRKIMQCLCCCLLLFLLHRLQNVHFVFIFGVLVLRLIIFLLLIN